MSELKVGSKKAVRTPAVRRTQAQRTEEMRAKLSQAAFEIVAEKGHSAFRTAAVAARAGVSQGAQVHHFATKDGLTLAALEYAFAEASRLSRKRLAAIPAGANPLPHLLADLREFFLGTHYWVALDIAIDGSKTDGIKEEISRIAGEYRGQVYANWSRVLVDSGWAASDAEEIVRIAASMLGGMGMRSLWEDVTPHLDAVIARIEQMIVNTWPLPAALDGKPKRRRTKS
ncbi:TetR/AcrR family transcriptional regulator [Sphingomonas sp. ID0503]|uniref:TetR/AcrR family transcriptional regulator n=1 Tax=Sphingomonas sp. ID0503 TaxID=3399691 RepID=UPI003AFA91EF